MSAAPAPSPSELAELPRLLRQMVRAVGIGSALKLVEWRGGTPIFIPQRLGEDHDLWVNLGRKAAEWLCENYPGEYIQIPKAEDYLRAKRDQEIRRKNNDENISAAQLAQQYSLHIRQVWRILGEGPVQQDARQGKLL